MRLITIFTLVLTTVAASAQAHYLEGQLGEEIVEITYVTHLKQFSMPDKEFTASIFFNEENDIVTHFGILSEVLKDVTPITFQVGGKVYLAGLSAPDDDVFGIAVGLAARLKVPLKPIPVYLSASIFAAPEVLTSGSNVNIVDVNLIRAEIDLTPTTLGFVGLRKFDIDRSDIDADRKLVNEMYIGARYRF